MEKRLFLTKNNMKIQHETLLRGVLLWILYGFRVYRTFPTTEEPVVSSSSLITNTSSNNLLPGWNGSEAVSEEWINGEEEEVTSHQTTTFVPFDVNSGNLKLKATPCEEPKDCRNIDGSYCNKQTGLCSCRADHPISDSFDCFRESRIGEFCHYDVQCVSKDSQSRCDSTLHICQCQSRFVVKGSSSKRGWCVENDKELNTKAGSYMDPALFGIMGGLVLMFIIICVVLQLFARAQFRDNRTIFNTPNPRLMNVSLMKDSKFFGRASKRKSNTSTKHRNSFVRTQSSDKSHESQEEDDDIFQGRSHMNNSNSMDPNNGASESIGRTKSVHEKQKNSPETARVTVESSA
ncbi:unnamed protein product [Lepeophtheirus salmonis]|uniref:(salmon louse) hypothetical protein n=3 Tax=Lepeophtheirus salmonis TaxID=72036 RepID=A0A7R8CBR3_LEPSM|nr:unnamed protein product [Lepeophtheirus salmonis]CAF2758586.1 unnamed protein product [Lepeophtheirus salmonis]